MPYGSLQDCTSFLEVAMWLQKLIVVVQTDYDTVTASGKLA